MMEPTALYILSTYETKSFRRYLSKGILINSTKQKFSLLHIVKTFSSLDTQQKR